MVGHRAFWGVALVGHALEEQSEGRVEMGGIALRSYAGIPSGPGALPVEVFWYAMV